MNVGELAARLGVPLEDLVQTPLMGSLGPDAPFFCTFAWDIHHERLVTTADDLAFPAALGARVVADDRVRFLRR